MAWEVLDEFYPIVAVASQGRSVCPYVDPTGPAGPCDGVAKAARVGAFGDTVSAVTFLEFDEALEAAGLYESNGGAGPYVSATVRAALEGLWDDIAVARSNEASWLQPFQGEIHGPVDLPFDVYYEQFYAKFYPDFRGTTIAIDPTVDVGFRCG